MEHELTWGMPVVLYLFLAGVGAGAVTVSGSVLLRGGDYSGGGFFKLARYGALIGPIPVILGTCLIIFELGRWDRAFNLFKVINLSPMSIGSWFLGLFIITSLLYAAAFLPSFLPRFEPLSKRLASVLHVLAWINVPLGIGVAVYTGILLGAMPSRPLWNSPILALLFLISALSTGVATILLARVFFKENITDSASEHHYHETGYMLTSADLLLIGFEILVIFLFIMFAHLTIGNLKYAMAIILPGGEMAGMFWFWVVIIGLVIPGLLEMVYVLPKMIYRSEFRVPRISEAVISLAVLAGGFMLRYVIVIAGQITGPMGI
ncbi:MAG TPA: NrfD/PsrC family molybdoenzyme membrane anchor subunit [Gammaproteobacteria bacterium]|nr:NrfD/PsrC family molybdoenzyme membrane anchor subunit [Gammaproteobacteria bacterium]